MSALYWNQAKWDQIYADVDKITYPLFSSMGWINHMIDKAWMVSYPLAFRLSIKRESEYFIRNGRWRGEKLWLRQQNFAYGLHDYLHRKEINCKKMNQIHLTNHQKWIFLQTGIGSLEMLTKTNTFFSSASVLYLFVFQVIVL